jgi:hypothetical protein
MSKDLEEFTENMLGMLDMGPITQVRGEVCHILENEEGARNMGATLEEIHKSLIRGDITKDLVNEAVHELTKAGVIKNSLGRYSISDHKAALEEHKKLFNYITGLAVKRTLEGDDDSKGGSS